MVYAGPAYGNHATNLAQIGFASDKVFSAGHALELCTATGDTTKAYIATITVGIAA